jgi:hypothetical protein
MPPSLGGSIKTPPDMSRAMTKEELLIKLASLGHEIRSEHPSEAAVLFLLAASISINHSAVVLMNMTLQEHADFLKEALAQHNAELN